MLKKRSDDDFFDNIDFSIDEESEEKNTDGESILFEKMKKEKTKSSNSKISKNQKRKPVAFSIHEDVKKDFDEYCEENLLNKSVLVESLIKKYLKENR